MFPHTDIKDITGWDIIWNSLGRLTWMKCMLPVLYWGPLVRSLCCGLSQLAIKLPVLDSSQRPFVCVCVTICPLPECSQVLAVTVAHSSPVSSHISRVRGEPRAHCWSLPCLRGPRHSSGQRVPVGIIFPLGPCSAPSQAGLGFHSFRESEAPSLQAVSLPVTTA